MLAISRVWAAAALLLLPMAVAGCTTAGPSSVKAAGAAGASGSPAEDPAAALQPEGPSGSAYTLEDLSSCRVTDALTIMENQLPEPVRITSVRMSATADYPGTERASASVAAYQAGTASGYLGAGSSLAQLRGHELVPAVGATLAPAATSGTWYELVLQVDVLGAHASPWSIDKVTVGYEVGKRQFTATFPQSVKLAATACPPAAAS